MSEEYLLRFFKNLDARLQCSKDEVRAWERLSHNLPKGEGLIRYTDEEKDLFPAQMQRYNLLLCKGLLRFCLCVSIFYGFFS